MEVWLIVVNVLLFIILLFSLIYCLQMLKALREAKAKKEALEDEPAASLLRPGYDKAALFDEPCSSEDEQILIDKLDSTQMDVKTYQETSEEDAECSISDDEDSTSQSLVLSAYGEEPLLKSGSVRNEPDNNLKHEGTRLVASFIYCKSTPNYLAGKVTGLFDLPGRQLRFDMYRIEITLLPRKIFVLSTKRHSAWVSCQMNEYFKFSFTSTPPENGALRIRVYGLKLRYGIAGEECRVAEAFVNMNHIVESEKGMVFSRILS